MTTSNVHSAALPSAPKERLYAWLDSHGNDSGAHIEYHATPGRPLGGPFTSLATRKSSLTRVSEDDLAARHLAYLRDAYRQGGSVKLELDQLAGLLAYSRNRIAVIGPHPQVLHNVMTAAQKLAARLPPLDAPCETLLARVA